MFSHSNEGKSFFLRKLAAAKEKPEKQQGEGERVAALEEQVRLSFLFLFEEPLLGLPINWFGGADVGLGEKIERGQGGRQF